MAYVTDEGIMNGTSSTTFSPLSTTNRAMMVTMLWRMEGSPEVDYELDYTDVAADQYYTEAVRWAASTGIMDGYGDNVFGITNPITREQMATVLYRYAEYKDIEVTASGDLTTFTDGDKTSAWALDAMKWAVGAGLINGVENNALNPQGASNRAQVATVLMRYDSTVK